MYTQKLSFGTRKIRAMGYNRLITLPGIWLVSNGLKVGDRLTLEMGEDGSLIIRPLKEDDDDE